MSNTNEDTFQCPANSHGPNAECGLCTVDAQLKAAREIRKENMRLRAGITHALTLDDDSCIAAIAALLKD